MIKNSTRQYEMTVGDAWAGDVRIAYQVSGQGPALVCCHAMGWDHTLWDAHRASFSRRYQLITFDQRGSGSSDHPPFTSSDESQYTSETFAEDLRAVLDHLNIDKANILGFSMGAIAVLEFATRWPERVDRLILASAMASRLPEVIIKRARGVEELLERKGLNETYQFYFSGPLFEGISDTEEFKHNMQSVLNKASPHGFKGSFRVTIDRPSLVDVLHKITAPTLILVGERDQHYLAEAALLAEKIPNAKKTLIEKAGHALTVQQPEMFEREVLRFLSR